jgi:D-amino-acid dehydrogenase
MPKRLLDFTDAKVVATPLGERLRFAGTMEFDGTTDRFNALRIAAIVRSVAPFFHDIDWSKREEEWVGPRPMTADGLPFIGPIPTAPQVIVATGHNMFGLTLAPSTGRVVADLISGREPSVNLHPFAPERV